MLRDLLKVAKENFDHFSANESAAGLRFRAIFQEIDEVVTKDEPVVEQIKTFAPSYDFDESSPGNGYRGFVFVYDAAVAKTLQLSLDIQTKRESFFFRSKFYQNETAAFVGVLRNLSIVASGLLVSHSKAKGSCLLNEEGVDDIEKIVASVELEVFYGRALLFHFPESLRGAGYGFAALTSAYSEFYFTKERTFMRMLRFPYNLLKYFTCKETLAKRLVEINENVQIDFTKASMEFFNSNVATFVTSLKGPRLPINKTFKTAATAQLVFSETQEKMIEVPVPSSFIGPGPVSCRLMSATRRKGMIGLKPRQNAADMSKSLVVHVHGGGWCTQNSKIHGPYLRKWAAELDVPILSIDYNLAPESPFPRPVDEVFFAYCWALNNLDSLGSTGENVIFVADASGCSIITACLIKCIEMGVRKPKALLTIYGAFALNYYMAPSRLLSVFESVVPYQLLTSYVGAYAGAFKPDEESNTPNRQVPKKSEKRVVPVIPKDYLMSPYLAPKEILNKFPKTHVLSTNLDCCLDESVEFAKRLRDAGADVKCEVYEGLNHGFLNFAHVSEDCFKAAVDCAKLIAELLELEWFNRP